MSRNCTNLTTFFITLSLFLLSFSSFSKEKELKLKKGRQYVVTISTTHGDVVVELLNETPLHRDNFAKLVEEGFYDGILFHRVIKDFMIQAGDETTRDRSESARANYGEGGKQYTLEAEILPQFPHYRGVLGAARERSDNPEKRSSGSQFYIVQCPVTDKMKISADKALSEKKITQEQYNEYLKVGGTPHLDGDFTVFGRVLKGMDAVDAIANEKVNKKDCPEKEMEILQMTVKQYNLKKIKKLYN